MGSMITKDLKYKLHYTLLKPTYSNTLTISPPKPESFQIKFLIFFPISARNIDCGLLVRIRLGEAVLTNTLNLFLSRNKKKKMYTPVNPSFTI